MLVQLDTKLSLLFLGQIKNLHIHCLSASFLSASIYLSGFPCVLSTFRGLTLRDLGSFENGVVEGVKIKRFRFADAVRGAREASGSKFKEGATGPWFSLLV
jgi:hypothetical protein